VLVLILYSGLRRGWFVRRGVLLARGLLEDGEQLRGLLGD
jgi:hypothetical protein